MADFGWLCSRVWRFGGPGPVAGMGSYQELFDAYEAAGGAKVDPEVVRWWETLGTLMWGVMCVMQATAHTSGAIRSVELAAIGRRVAEQEHDLLGLLGLEPKLRAHVITEALRRGLELEGAVQLRRALWPGAGMPGFGASRSAP